MNCMRITKMMLVVYSRSVLFRVECNIIDGADGKLASVRRVS